MRSAVFASKLDFTSGTWDFFVKSPKYGTRLGFETEQSAHKRRRRVENRRLWIGTIFRLTESTVFTSGCD